MEQAAPMGLVDSNAVIDVNSEDAVWREWSSAEAQSVRRVLACMRVWAGPQRCQDAPGRYGVMFASARSTYCCFSPTGAT